jgi:hypothetical protein
MSLKIDKSCRVAKSRPVCMGQLPQTFLTNPSKRRIYLCKIPTVRNFDSVTETAFNIRSNYSVTFQYF